MSIVAKMAEWIKMALGTKVGLGPGHIVLDGDQLPSPKRGHSPQFSAHFYCGQTAGCIKMPLGMEVGLSPGDIVLDEDQVPTQKKHSPPIFGQCLLWPNHCMYQDITWYGGRPQPRRYCIRRGHSRPPPNFRPMSVVAKWLDGR